MTPYQTIYNRFLSKVQDLELAKMSPKVREKMLDNWLNEALALIDLDRIKLIHDFSLMDEETQSFVLDLYNYEIEGIALYMMVAWYEDKVNSLDHTLLFMGSKDEKWTNQRDHWKQTKDIQDSYRKRARKYFRNHSSRFNEYITDDYDIVLQEANAVPEDEETTDTPIDELPDESEQDIENGPSEDTEGSNGGL